MGGSSSKQEPKTQNIAINHNKFKEIKLLKQDDIIRSNISIEHESDYEQWQQKLNKISNLDDQVILLPKAYQYTRKAICGSSGSIQIDFDNYPYILADELKNRNKVNRYFEQSQIWYLLYSLVTAAHDFQKINSKIGDVRPQNIFINEQGHIKISNLYSWPAQVTNYIKCVYDNQKTYLSPEQAQAAKEGQSQTYINKFKSQSFSIGLTCLQAGLIRSHLEDLYNQNKTLNTHKFGALIKQWWGLVFKSINEQTQLITQKQYSDQLKLTVTALCDLQHQDRLTADEVYNWLKAYHREINQLKYFQPGMPPIKNINKYSQLLNNTSKVGQRQQHGQYGQEYGQQQIQGYGQQGGQGRQGGQGYSGQYNINNNMYGNAKPNIGNTHLQIFKNYANPTTANPNTGINAPQVSPSNVAKGMGSTFYNYSNLQQPQQQTQTQAQPNKSNMPQAQQQQYKLPQQGQQNVGNGGYNIQSFQKQPQSQPTYNPSYNTGTSTMPNPYPQTSTGMNINSNQNYNNGSNIYKPSQPTTSYAPQTVSQYTSSQPYTSQPSSQLYNYQPSSNTAQPQPQFILNQQTSTIPTFNTNIGLGTTNTTSQPYTMTGTNNKYNATLAQTTTNINTNTTSTTGNYSKPTYNLGNTDFLKQIDQQILKSKQGFK